MQPTITSEVVVAYAQCPRKAYLLLFSPEQGEPHEYVGLLERQQGEHQARYLERLQSKHADVQPYTVENLRNGSEMLINGRLQANGCDAACGVLTKVEGTSPLDKHSYEPSICVGTHSISTEQKLELSFVGHVLACLQHTAPLAGRIIGMDGKVHTVQLGESAKTLLPLLMALHAWTAAPSPTPPPLVLNKHCPLCPFRRLCYAQAEHEDNLSLLNGVTARVMRQYEKKGIFTVKQLSYLFKPRKPKKRSRKPPPVTHKFDLQALAIRERKIFLHTLPVVSRQPVEIFVDIEGVPDRGLYYLIGVLVCQEDTTEHYAFWADTHYDEQHIWHQLVATVSQYPEAPLYHYGSYEPRAIATLAKRYNTEAANITKRLVNVNSYVYGRVYFPVRSNRLKDIGKFIGAAWTSPDASGLQSLVWRHHWERTDDSQYQTHLLTYNREDCAALKVLMDALSKIQVSADLLSEVDFADKRKQPSTALSQEIHSQFGTILKFAHFDYEKKKISFHQEMTKETSEQEKKEKKRYAAQKSSQKIKNIKQKVRRIVQVERGEACPQCARTPLLQTEETVKRTIIDLVSTKNGIKKTLTQYVGFQGYCTRCHRLYSPPDIAIYGSTQLYGHRFKAWIVYQRIALRMTYKSIIDSLEEYFNEKVSIGSIPGYIQDLGQYYAETENAVIQHLLKNPFIHVDETKISILGVNQYVWVFTDGRYVIFKLTETRESTIVQELLANYKGVLVADFYPGYDALPYTHQKCWVHLIRNLNDDLLESPFDTELETFAAEVKNLIIPIMDTVQKHGLKHRKLHKFHREVMQFFERVIYDKPYKSDITQKYQKLFARYKSSLFTFLDQDGIPWHNNMAERAIRHVAKQRSISTSFHEAVMKNYLILLGIRQACRFQGKSFFKFLFSGETDLDKFKARKRKL